MSKSDHVVCVMSNHNYGKWITEAIDSVVDQDYHDKSLIIGDDLSTDDSVDRVLKHVNNIQLTSDLDDRTIYNGSINGMDITLLAFKTNNKQGWVRNRCIEHGWGRGAYFANIDSDDSWLQGKLSKSIKVLKDDPNVHMVVTDYYIENTETGSVTLECKPPFDKGRLMAGDCHTHSGAIFTKEILEKVGLYDELCVPKEDYFLALKVTDFGMAIHIPEPLVWVRVTPKNSTVSHSDEYHMKQIKLMWERYHQWRQTL